VSRYSASDTYGTDASLWIKAEIMTQHNNNKWIRIETNRFLGFPSRQLNPNHVNSDQQKGNHFFS
jgi:hypothetical protein